jgi:uncharacterized membrane protein YesL
MVSFYNEMFLLIGLSLFWWITGGIFVGLAWVAALTLFQAGGPWWMAPLLAIPAGPANAGLAAVVRQAARELQVDRSVYLDGLRQHWRRALVVNAISMTILSLLCLNTLFYLSQPALWVRALAFLFGYLVLFWLSAQLYLFPALAGLHQPSVRGALRIAATAVFANPFFSLVLLLIAAALTAFSVVLAILILLAWPALMALLGEHSLKLFVERVGGRR